METSMVNDRQRPTVELELENQAKPTELLFIDLDLLDNNPYQPRAQRDELKSAQLRESIASQGQLQPILVRRAGARWQIIFGHGRVEALRKLRNDAKSEADRSRFSRVRAEERSNVSDDQMLLLGLLESIQREDISPLDCAAALARLRSLRPDLQTIDQIAGAVSMEPMRVKRLLRLHAAPQVIKDAVSKGQIVLVKAEAGAPDAEPDESASEPDGSAAIGPRAKTQETRRLDVIAALELAKLHAYWVENSTDDTVSREGTPDQRVAALIDRALKQGWGLRRVQAVVEKLRRGDADSPEPNDSPASKEAKGLGERTQLQPLHRHIARWVARLLESIRLWKQVFLRWRELMSVLREHMVETLPPPGRLPPAGQLPSGAGQLPSSGKPEAGARPAASGTSGGERHPSP